MNRTNTGDVTLIPVNREMEAMMTYRDNRPCTTGIFRAWMMLVLLIMFGMILFGCGDDKSPDAVISPTSASQDMNQVLSQNLPNYQKTCINDHEALFPAQYSNCVPVFGLSHCDNDQALNTLKLESEWQSIQDWVKAQMNVCIQQGAPAALCFAESERELARRSEYDCAAQVSWL